MGSHDLSDMPTLVPVSNFENEDEDNNDCCDDIIGDYDDINDVIPSTTPIQHQKEDIETTKDENEDEDDKPKNAEELLLGLTSTMNLSELAEILNKSIPEKVSF